MIEQVLIILILILWLQTWLCVCMCVRLCVRVCVRERQTLTFAVQSSVSGEGLLMAVANAKHAKLAKHAVAA